MIETGIRDCAKVLLRRVLGNVAEFRPGQLEAIETVVHGRNRALVVQATGWGKSLVYFLATRLLRDAGAGPTLLVSPLLSLMRDQMRMAEGLGVRAESINSTNTGQWGDIAAAVTANRLDLLLISPERLGNERFLSEVMRPLQRGVGMLVVDEAHCISDWGHDFRPDYRRIVRVVRQLPPSVPVLATTATANDRVVRDIRDQIGGDLEVLRGPLARASLRLQAIRLADQAERLAWLAENLHRLPGSGIVYCLTVADTRRVASWLGRVGIEAAPYFGDLPTEDRERLEKRLRENDLKALVATVALGMGFDKPDLGFVVHFQRPGSIVAYYQQIGRAGRALDDAIAVLLSGREDDEIHDYFIAQAFPGKAELASVLDVVEANPGIAAAGIGAHLNLRHRRIEQALKFLEVDQAVYREGRKYFRSLTTWEYDGERVDAVTARREAELERMRQLVDSDRCLMETITAELDDPASAPCGRCAICAGQILPETASAGTVERASQFLRRTYRPIEPRYRWPAGHGGRSHGVIPEHLRAEEGRSLSIWGDAGWGQLVRAGKYQDGRFSDELVERLAQLLSTWPPSERPTWVTAVPSRRHPLLVSDLAERLATRLGLPFRPALRQARDTRPQKEQQNSAQQAANVDGAFVAAEAEVLAGPVILLDDVVDSRWTFTVCAYVLRQAGSGPVYPVALAEAGPARSDT